jgi:hypothetical protein
MQKNIFLQNLILVYIIYFMPINIMPKIFMLLISQKAANFDPQIYNYIIVLQR